MGLSFKETDPTRLCTYRGGAHIGGTLKVDGTENTAIGSQAMALTNVCGYRGGSHIGGEPVDG